MLSLNLMQLIGRLGKDPEVLKTTQNGLFVRISLATSKRIINDKEESEEVTEWHTVYFNNQLGKSVVDHLYKGSVIYVSGELRTTEWQNKENQRQFSTGIYASKLLFLDQKPAQELSSSPD